MNYHVLIQFNELFGKVLNSVTVNQDSNQITFVDNEGKTYVQYHQQHCCEEVWIESIDGDLEDLLNSPIVKVEEVSNNTQPSDPKQYSATWTFYKIDTVKGGVTIRWNGESNGCYSEKAELYIVQ